MGKLLVIGVQDSSKKSGGTYHYKNKINLQDPNLLLIVLEDLENYGLPLQKVINMYLDKKLKTFPF